MDAIMGFISGFGTGFAGICVTGAAGLAGSAASAIAGCGAAMDFAATGGWAAQALVEAADQHCATGAPGENSHELVQQYCCSLLRSR